VKIDTDYDGGDDERMPGAFSLDADAGRLDITGADADLDPA